MGVNGFVFLLYPFLMYEKVLMMLRTNRDLNPRIKGGKANCSSIIGTLRTDKLTYTSSSASFLSPFPQSTYLLSISLLFQRFRIKAFPQPFRRQRVQPAHRRRPPIPGRLPTPASASEAGQGRRRASSCITSILSNEFYHGKEAAYIVDKKIFDFTRLMCSRPFRLLLFIKETDSW